MKRKQRMAMIGLGTILFALSFHVAIIWLYVPLNWFSTWSETRIRGCRVKPITVDMPKKVPLEQEFVIRVTVQNLSYEKEKPCRVKAVLSAPDFSVKEEVLRRSLAPGEKALLTWNLFTKDVGKRPIWLTINGQDLDKVYVTTVSDGIWLPDIGIWIGLLLYFLGGCLSLPWWVELIQQRRLRCAQKSKEGCQ